MTRGVAEVYRRASSSLHCLECWLPMESWGCFYFRCSLKLYSQCLLVRLGLSSVDSTAWIRLVLTCNGFWLLFWKIFTWYSKSSCFFCFRYSMKAFLSMTICGIGAILRCLNQVRPRSSVVWFNLLVFFVFVILGLAIRRLLEVPGWSCLFLVSKFLGLYFENQKNFALFFVVFFEACGYSLLFGKSSCGNCDESFMSRFKRLIIFRCTLLTFFSSNILASQDSLFSKLFFRYHCLISDYPLLYLGS